MCAHSFSLVNWHFDTTSSAPDAQLILHKTAPMASALQEKKGASDYQDQKQFVSELFTSAEGACVSLSLEALL